MPKGKKIKKAASKSQRRLFGWAKGCVDGDTKNCPPKIKKLGQTFKDKYPKEFKSLATTKHKGLPEKVKKNKKKNENVKRFNDFINESHATTSDFKDIPVKVTLGDYATNFGILVEFKDGSFDEYIPDRGLSHYNNLEEYKKATGMSKDDIENMSPVFENVEVALLTFYDDMEEGDVMNIYQFDV